MPALTPTVLQASSDMVNRSVYTTGSITPVADQPIFVEIASVGANAVTGVTGCGLTWVQVAITNQGNSIRLAVYRSAGAAPTTGALSLTHAGTQTSCVWTITQWANADEGGTNGSAAVVQTKTTALQASQSSLSTTFDAPLSSADNVHLCSIARNRTDAITGDVDFASNSNQSGLGESIDTSSQWAANQLTNTSTFATATHATCSISIEIKAQPEDAPGTTTSAIIAGEPIKLGFVLAIEGYEYLLTDWGTTAPVLTAWAGSGWTQALTGLEIRGQIKQAIEPWSDSIEAPQLTFAVTPEETDQFGIDVWKTKPTFQTRLNDVFTPASNGSGTLTVHQTAAAAASGRVYLGGKAVTYSAKGASSFTVTAANTFTPFESNAGAAYAPGHPQPTGDIWDVGPNALVQDVQHKWIGKKVALYVHQIRGSVWDTRSGAQIEFAGRIREVSEDEDGKTILECEDLRADIRDATLSFNQWVGYVKEGICLEAGTRIRVKAEVIATTTPAVTTSGEFTVVASGASGADEADAGYYSTETFISMLDAWLEADGSIDGTWSARLAPVGSGLRTQFRAFFNSSANRRRMQVEFQDPRVAAFLGFPRRSSTSDGWIIYESQTEGGSDVTLLVESPNAPYRVQVPRLKGAGVGATIEFDANEGVWWDHHELLASPFRAWAGSDNYSFIAVGKSVGFGKFESNTRISDVDFGTYLNRDKTHLVGPGGVEGYTVDDPAERLEVRQVVVLGGALTDLIPKLLASVDGTGTNHADYDILPFGAGIPWSLLGDDFLTSLESLEQATRSQGLMVVVDKPKKLIDLLLPELALRFAWIIFKDGVYQVVSPPTPSARTADHEFTEANKASPDGNPARTTAVVKDEWLRNVIKVDYNRTLTGEYQDSITVRDRTSIADYGESQPVTIKAASAYGDAEGTGASVEDLVASLAARVLPALGKPCKVLTRSLAPPQYHVCPGDTCTISDDFVRDPQTGVRGVSNRPGIVLSVNKDWGQGGGDLFGEATILISDEDRTYPLAPCAQVDHTYTSGAFTAGYDSAAGRLKLVAKQHQLTLGTMPNDASWFEDGDLVRITQIDPADPTSITAWDRVIATGGVDATNNIITLTATLSSPSYDAALRYRVVPQLYSDVQASQQLGAFIADDGDNLIEDLAQPNLYGESNQLAFSRNNYTTLPSLIPTEAYAEGRPVHPGLVADLGTMLNNLVSYKTAPNMPMLVTTAIEETSTDYVVKCLFPFFVGGVQQPGTARYITVAPRTTTSAPVGVTTVRVTSSAQPPRGALTAPVWPGPRHQVVFTNNANPNPDGVESTPQDLRIITGQSSPGMTWITVELKTSATYTAKFFGLSTFYLGPIEAA